MTSRGSACLGLQCRSQLSTHVLSFPFVPLAKSFAQVFIAKFSKITQQPHKRSDLLVLFVLSGCVDLLAETLDPHVAVVNVTERSLNSSSAFRVRSDRTSPALLKKFYCITQALRSDAHFVKRLDVERSEQPITKPFQFFQAILNDGAGHLSERDL